MTTADILAERLRAAQAEVRKLKHEEARLRHLLSVCVARLSGLVVITSDDDDNVHRDPDIYDQPPHYTRITVPIP